MLTFFRRIRKGILGSGQAKKYVLYAIGEITLVVIGILIALQINNWNEWMKERKTEQLILYNLLDDFQRTKGGLESVVNNYSNWIFYLESKLRYVGVSATDLTPEMRDTIAAIAYVTPDFADGTLNSILNSNQLEVIQNKQLKRELTAYPTILNVVKQKGQTVEDFVLDVHRPILESYISLTENIGEKDWIKFPDLAKNAAASDFKGLLNDINYQNALIREIRLTMILRGTTKQLISRTNAIIDLINQDLKSD